MSGARWPSAKRPGGIRSELAERWPEIGRWLYIHDGEVLFDDGEWLHCAERNRVRGEELATAYEQQAAYYEWLLVQRLTGHLAGDRLGQYLCATWAAEVIYSCQRLATRARGDDPGERVPVWVRRPDLDAEGDALAELRDSQESAWTRPSVQKRITNTMSHAQETPGQQLPGTCAEPVRAPGAIRTHTGRVLSPLPLPVGLRGLAAKGSGLGDWGARGLG